MLTPLSNIHCESKVRIMMTLYKILFLHILLRISSQLRRAFAWMTLVKFAPSFTLQNSCANWTPNKRQFKCGISDNSNVDFGIVVVHALFLQVLYHMMKSPYSPWLQEHLKLYNSLISIEDLNLVRKVDYWFDYKLSRKH